jgi:hypothetical protein
MKRLTWGRPKADHTILADHKGYRSKCGRYRVVHVHIVYGAGPAGLPDRWYSLHVKRDVLFGHNVATGKESIIGDFGSERLARRACMDHAERNGCPSPICPDHKPKKKRKVKR